MKRAQSTHLAGHILPLLANSPELNPVENLWQLTRDNWLSNRVFKSYEDIVEHCCYAWRAMQERKICPSADWRIARMNVLSISCVSLNVARQLWQYNVTEDFMLWPSLVADADHALAEVFASKKSDESLGGVL